MGATPGTPGDRAPRCRPPLLTWPEGPQESSPGCKPWVKNEDPKTPQRLGGLKGRGNPAQGFILRKAPLARYAGETGSEDQAIRLKHWAFPAPIQGATGSRCLVPRVSPWAGFLRPFGPRVVGLIPIPLK